MTYLIPSGTATAEIEIQRSRFLARAGNVRSVEEAKAFIAGVRQAMPDANHHVYAYRIGYGNTVTEGMSDDGEPSGTSGPPILSILRGIELGDVIIVVTRYFGGRKLGTGGLVRAYSEAARRVLDELSTEIKIARSKVSVDLPYHIYEVGKQLILAGGGEISNEDFTTSVRVEFIVPDENVEDLRIELREASSGQVLLEVEGSA
ncbi:MAG: YigZ family protein [Chloroflexota bacterium]